MKRVLTITFLLFTAAIASYSQLPYRPMLEEGKVWVYENHHFEILEIRDNWEIIYDEQISFWNFTIMGDTVINDVQYSKLYKYSEKMEPVYYFALREEGTTLYCIQRSSHNEHVFCEFNAEKYPDYYIRDNRVWEDTEDYIEVDGTYFVRHNYKWTVNSNSYICIAVEGIGYENQGILGGLEGIPIARDNTLFLRCELNGKTIFTNDDFHAPAVIPTAIQEVQTKKNAASPYYDLQGRRLQNKPGKGVYVSKGRKMVR